MNRTPCQVDNHLSIGPGNRCHEPTDTLRPHFDRSKLSIKVAIYPFI